MSARVRPLLKRSLLCLSLVALSLGLAGWNMTGPQTTLLVDGPLAQMQKNLFMTTVYVALGIFVVVGGVLAYAQVRYRAKPENENDPVPEQTHGKPIIEVGLIAASTLLLVIIAIPTIKGSYMMGDDPSDEPDVFKITAIGNQWWFKFDYPDQGFATGNEMVIPVGRPVRIDLRTIDVGHSFWIPRLAGKTDMIRNRPNWMWLKADKSGYYWGHCAEFCGESHSYMRFRVVALDAADFAEWMKKQAATARVVDPEKPAEPGTPVAYPTTSPTKTLAGFFAADTRERSSQAIEERMTEWRSRQTPVPADENPKQVAEGRKLFTQMGCIGCHTVRGHEGAGLIGPDLTHFSGRTTIAAATLDNNPDNLKRWIREPESVKPGNLMWLGYSDAAKKMNEEQVSALAAYLTSLR